MSYPLAFSTIAKQFQMFQGKSSLIIPKSHFYDAFKVKYSRENEPEFLGTTEESVIIEDDFDHEMLKLWEQSLYPTFHTILPKISLASILGVQSESKINERNHPKIVGHRGSIYKYPENTIRSFLASYESGADAVELDVFYLKCGTLVVFHGGGTDENPGDLKDYCNIDGSILNYTAKEARELLHLNPYYDEFPCPKNTILDTENSFIPTLEEVLLALKNKNIEIKIELKGPDTTLPVLNLVERLQMVDQCHYSSFAHERIALLRQLRPQKHPDGSHVYKTGALFNDVPDRFVEIAQEIGASEVHLKYDTCTKERVDLIHAAGMGSMCWFRGAIGMKEDIEKKYYDVGNEDTIMYDVVMRTGVGSMCVNKPDVLVNMLTKEHNTKLKLI